MSDEKNMIRARFFKEPVQDEAKTAAAGRPIFEDMEMIELAIPGDRLTRHIGLASEVTNGSGLTYIDRYPDEYAAFKRGESLATVGQPLEQWPQLTRAMVMEMKAIGIMSVEELAGITDDAARRIGPHGRDLREQARAHISRASGNAELEAQAKRIAELEAKLARAMSSPAFAAPEPVAAPPAPPTDPADVAITDATDDQLKAFIKEKTGSAPRGNISRSELERRVSEIAAETQEAA